MASLEGFGSGDAGQPGRRSSNVASCPRVTVDAPVSPADRARSGHASVEVAYYGLISAPWSSSSPSELRITRVFPCVARGFKARASFMFAGCRWWLLMPIRGHLGGTPGMRRPGLKQVTMAARVVRDLSSAAAMMWHSRMKLRRASCPNRRCG